MLICTAKLMMSPTAMYAFYSIGVLPVSTNLGMLGLREIVAQLKRAVLALQGLYRAHQVSGALAQQLRHEPMKGEGGLRLFQLHPC